MGCWLCISRDSFTSSEKIFLINDGANEGSASSRYCTSNWHNCSRKRWLLFESTCTLIIAILMEIEKEAATHITTATNCPPPMSSVAARGEWSIGQVLDLYWQFGDAGDYFAGRCLAGLDPNSPLFAGTSGNTCLYSVLLHANIIIFHALQLCHLTSCKEWRMNISKKQCSCVLDLF